MILAPEKKNIYIYNVALISSENIKRNFFDKHGIERGDRTSMTNAVARVYSTVVGRGRGK